MIFLSIAAIVLSALPAVLLAINLPLYRRTPRGDPGTRPSVSVLVPARDEEVNIADALAAILANTHVELDVVVLDDHSADRTPDIVRRIGATDSRVRLHESAALPAGWSGKQFACHQLAALARCQILLFIDADVRLTPDAISRMAAFLDQSRAGLVSGFPRQLTLSFAERLIIPLIDYVLLGYLPFAGLRWTRLVGFGAGCGQLMMARRDAYLVSGGHGAIATSRHDGVTLPRAFRRAGFATDLFDGGDIASCRMYRGGAEVWNGFVKNATEGMAGPLALPIWTIVLLGGHVLPWLLLVDGQTHGAGAIAVLLSLGSRIVVALRNRSSRLGAILLPASILVLLAIQYDAVIRLIRRRPATWRGRSYPAGTDEAGVGV
jgi:cellulose synthase/poly-beta-1,6-N-acetylglucosamine synthase-like glycosyltransferase